MQSLQGPFLIPSFRALRETPLRPIQERFLTSQTLLPSAGRVGMTERIDVAKLGSSMPDLYAESRLIP
jgi:hypothetical protein